jgi:hypothetical protein
MREILFARKKSYKRATLLCNVIAHRASQHRVPRFQSIKYRALRRTTHEVELHLTVHASQRS